MTSNPKTYRKKDEKDITDYFLDDFQKSNLFRAGIGKS